uniref:Peptidase M13 C-terminal domain-containing protein n=1 Tax=Timema douglasi TaxID=61478 RepID=A0A7R8VWY2_TIMDO|nr:unnamed protein product [Timema douglasi]
MNYGAIGFVIGHEITHGFDDQGRQFDKNGNLVDWWQAVTMKKYLAKTRCVIEQYGNYTDEHTGLKAYRAYLAWVDRNHVEQTLPGLDYTPRQMFWISAAQTWCSKYRAEAMHQRIITGVHSPGRFRVQGPCSNLEEFSKDFNCPRGSAMNPEKKCKVWTFLFENPVTSPVSPHDTPAPSEKIVRNKKRPRDGLPEQRQRGREKKTFVEYETLRGFFGSRYFLDISPRFSLCCHRLAMLILLDDLQDAGVGSSDEGQQGEGDDHC